MLPVLIVGAFAAVMAVFTLISLRDALIKNSIDKVHAMVDAAKNIAVVNHELVLDGKLTLAEAQERTRDAIRAMEFDGGSRVFAFAEQGIRIVSDTEENEGTSAWKSPHTQSMIQQALAGGGITYYRGARTLNGVVTTKNPKAAWSEHFAPWGWVIASAAYIEDVQTAFLQRLATVTVAFLVAASVVTFAVRRILRDLREPIDRLTQKMMRLADGDPNFEVTDQDRRDSIGDMARAMKVLTHYERERHELQLELRRLAFTDRLTGLQNRIALNDNLARAVDEAVSKNNQCSLLIVDVDRFKTINEILGHNAGDAVLLDVSSRLERAVKTQGSVGRLAADEFYIIVPDVEAAGGLPQLIEIIQSHIAEPISVGGETISVTASIGMASLPKDTTCAKDLLRFADTALHVAKKAGGNLARDYAAEMSEDIAARFRTEAMINDALQKDEFVAYYQAKVDLSSGEIIGAEALCRWRNGDNGFIAPSTFIPIAEETGQIVHIGEVMLRSACAFAVACNQRSGKHFVVAVNISARQLMYGKFLATLLQSLQETSCRPEWISLEITESLLLTDSGMVIDTLNSISALGIEIAIDDFGTGYSALSYLCRFPISCLKIDQSFVRNMLQDPQQEVLIRTIIKMAQGLGMKTVAEGVETKATARRLRQMGCELGQGYLWHKPSDADALLQQLPSESAKVFASSRVSA
jgi:diguanylate cyclase (GGDEF)-like protein